MTAAKVNFHQGFLWGSVCAQSTWWAFTSNAGTKPCRNGITILASAPPACFGQQQFQSVHTPQHISTCLTLLKFRWNKHVRKAGFRKHKPQLPAHKPRRPALFWAHQPEPRQADGCSSQPLPVPHWSECWRSDLREFSTGNCSGSLALSSRYPSGLPAMMTALLPLNCLTEHEGWLQLAPVQGTARRACTTKIYGSSAIDFKGCSTKSLGATPCITILRNSLWFPLRAIGELYIVLCLELKMLVSNTNPKLNHRIHLIFSHG